MMNGVAVLLNKISHNILNLTIAHVCALCYYRQRMSFR